MKRVVKSSLLAMCSAIAVTAVLAQEGQKTPEEQAQVAVDTRQGLQKVMNFWNAPLGAMLRNQKPWDAAVVAKSATNIAALGAMQPDVFAEDTHKFTLKTKARDGIWTNKSDFDAKSNNLVKLANDLAAVAKSGADKDALRKAAVAMGKEGCGGCHDQFKDR
jgi:cytochrome c556